MRTDDDVDADQLQREVLHRDAHRLEELKQIESRIEHLNEAYNSDVEPDIETNDSRPVN